jgi:hypothetical protein
MNPHQPTGMNELRDLLFEVWRNGRDKTDRYISVDQAEAHIQQIVERCIPAIDTRKHAVPGVDQGMQIGSNATIKQIRHNLQQAGLLRADMQDAEKGQTT